MCLSTNRYKTRGADKFRRLTNPTTFWKAFPISDTIVSGRQILISLGRFSSQVTVSVYFGIFQLSPTRMR
jgi:hypothetical protein